MNFLPHNIKWISVYEIRGNSYQEVLVATHKHSARDWRIIHGWVDPINGYTDFRIMAKPNGVSSSYPDREIPKAEILAIGIIQSYGHIDGHAQQIAEERRQASTEADVDPPAAP